MPDQTNDSLIAKVTANLKADPNYQPTNPIEASIVKQIKGTDPMQQGQPSQQGLGSIAPSQPMAPSYNPSVAMGPTYFAGMNAPQGYAEGGETSLNLDQLPSLNLNTGTQGYGDSGNFGNLEGFDKFRAAMRMVGESPDINPGMRILGRMFTGSLNGDPGMLGLAKTGKLPDNLFTEKEFKDYYAKYPENAPPPGYTPTAPAVSINPSSGNTSAQNSAFVNRRAKGGYLDGAGDGMSDSIPATIEGKQPARLADGEFVVPADVVSHIGNGSSKAGSQRLYSMLDKVRKARTGHTKQGKQINPSKYMPA
jgi:hypothetical protein